MTVCSVEATQKNKEVKETREDYPTSYCLRFLPSHVTSHNSERRDACH